MARPTAAPSRRIDPNRGSDRKQGSRSSLEKMMEILDLFDEIGVRWTPERMMKRLSVPRSTLYRYLKVLGDAGLVTSLPDVGYTLGPRVAELDYEMRTGDPLITDGRPLLQALVSEVPGVGLLCRHYRGRVLCVHQEGAVPQFRSSYERGRAMPLAAGAASRAILAYLRPATLRSLYDRHQTELPKRGLAVLQADLAAIRREGYCVSRGAVTPGVIGVAAPVFDTEGTVIGSLSITLWAAGVSERRLATVIDRVVFGARVLTNAMGRIRG
jgi:DNA-binding IclR family transcriptional regulator